MGSDPTGLWPAEVATFLRTTPTVLRAIAAGLPDRVLNWHPAPGEWCIKEVLGHLIEAERHDFAGRIRLIVESHQEPHLPRTEQVALAHTPADRRPPEGVRGVARGELGSGHRSGQRGLAEGRVSPGRRLSAHLRPAARVDLPPENHLRQALANVEAFVWPQMGYAQRFYRRDPAQSSCESRLEPGGLGPEGEGDETRPRCNMTDCSSLTEAARLSARDVNGMQEVGSDHKG